MDKRIATIELDAPGIVVFDPAVLNDFLKQNNISDSNIFDRFLDDEVLGWSVIEQGILLPIYEISEDEYSIFVDSISAGADGGNAIFEYGGLPLKVISGLVVISDLSALFYWDSDFFVNYKFNYPERLANTDYLDVTCGLFDVTVCGYTGLEAPLHPLGYGLQFKAVDSLPKVDEKIAVDDRNFTLQP